MRDKVEQRTLMRQSLGSEYLCFSSPSQNLSVDWGRVASETNLLNTYKNAPDVRWDSGDADQDGNSSRKGSKGPMVVFGSLLLGALPHTILEIVVWGD